MPYILFGNKPKSKGGDIVSVTDADNLVAVAPSSLRIFSNHVFSPLYSYMVGLFGLCVSIFSYPMNTYIHSSAQGLLMNPAEHVLPFQLPGLAVVYMRGKKPTEDQLRYFDKEGFSSMSYNQRIIYLLEYPDKGNFLAVDSFEGTDHTGPHPDKYLNQHGFRAFLTTRSILSRVCDLLSYVGMSGSRISESEQKKDSKASEGWIHAHDTPPDMVDTTLEFKFAKVCAYHLTSGADKIISTFVNVAAGESGTASSNSGSVWNSIGSLPPGILYPSSTSKITSSGFVTRFIRQLAESDIGIVGDTIARYFQKCLGDTTEEQLENFTLIKTGLGRLRTTSLGAELAHLCKSIEIAIMSGSGLMPIFSGNTYEGCAILGGAEPKSLIIHGEIFPCETATSVKHLVMNISTHRSALDFIASCFPDHDSREEVGNVTSMFDLRKLCLTLECSKEVEETILRKAGHLDFRATPWDITPNRLKQVCEVISRESEINDGFPLGRKSLFSRDIVLVALSCFGERDAPSWNIPGGTICSLKRSSPPIAAEMSRGASSKASQTSDAKWTMTIRKTDLETAVSEFRKMAETLEYRSSSSSVAGRVGHRSFKRDRMEEFWVPLRNALRSVNPQAAFEKEPSGTKRPNTDSPSTVGELETKRVRRMGV